MNRNSNISSPDGSMPLFDKKSVGKDLPSADVSQSGKSLNINWNNPLFLDIGRTRLELESVQRKEKMLQKFILKKKEEQNATGNIRKICCNCKKSQCLKLYCECFARQEFCGGCNCINCLNIEEFQAERDKAVKQTLERNPNAFEAKIAAIDEQNVIASILTVYI